MGNSQEQIPVLALWSAPRSRSTAFARMMAERGDRTVVHEPFSLVVDFGEVKVGDRVARSESDVLAALRATAAEKPVFFKDTTDFHYPALLADEGFLAAATHTFIIRHPAEAIASHHKLNPNLGRDEIGFAWLYEIFAAVQAATGTTPVVIDSDDLLDRPAETVRAYCSAVGIPFLVDALSWEPGMRPEWQTTSRWHASTSQTAGFRRDTGAGAEAVAADPVLRAYCDYHLPYYEKLRAAAIRP
ncbi:sulfotransferase family protein [Catellatospora chokoriensis]|uniref:Branched chain amino acid aminotransferase n=1 Tax=Catellatospora chokoriensis TaxID=310353 RepID=A0A8J3NRI9_9ACTN|nr:sulfotransferase family protein [Catellatospora chokoriensis]GIF90222.1 branched chain amino acid aminotransferase [Catellatospora chokoriensis]